MDRLAAHVVVHEQRGELVRRGYAHAVEMREGAVSVAEQAQHPRQHAVYGPVERLRGIDFPAREHLAQGQEVEEEIDEQARIAARVAAQEDLAVELAGEEPGPALNEPSSPSQERPA